MASGADDPADLAPLRQALGDLLATHRDAAKLTQRQLAAAIGYARVTVATAESGHRVPAEGFWTRCESVLDTGGELSRTYQQLADTRTRRKRDLSEQEQAGRRARAALWRVTEAAVSKPPKKPDVQDLPPPTSVPGDEAPVQTGGETALEQAESSGGGRSSVYVDSGQASVDALLSPIRVAMTTYHHVGVPVLSQDPEERFRAAAAAHCSYQRADYSRTARLLPGLLADLEVGRPETSRTALIAASVTYLAASKLAVKVGDTKLAWLGADRAAARAALAEDHTLHALALYQVACAFLNDRRQDDAERLAVQTLDMLGSAAVQDSQTISVRGALCLLAAMAAAANSRPDDSANHLSEAGRLASQLGRDGNHLWTGFGPTNVSIHRLSVSVALGRADQALALSDRLDTSALPAGLTSRRCQVHLDLAHACTDKREDPVAVLHLLEAERVAPQAMQANIDARRTLAELLRREQRSRTPGLRSLAQRAGVAA